ncbi:DUF2914 domain-containing protein [Aestuariibacter sp. AA17]|uniref:DUF2914 domain-containing protein n=1 Tax=Fluctibacter corallii TaxID=2984329 RepID=A0ABT3ABX8_9ALTE|nr:DUF2914 domain-containing protein [Aestuariibacter sp. AA17]MCV2886184.1 DUF2914 domain-containing protein [Aestuariibacter sp. AA17]
MAARLWFILVTSFVSFVASAEIMNSQLTTAIESREPVDDLGHNVDVSEGDIVQVMFFTHVGSMAGKNIVHRWLYKDQQMAAVTLNVRSNNYRTYSSKNIMASWAGEWQIQVWHDDLMLLSHDFTVTAK